MKTVSKHRLLAGEPWNPDLGSRLIPLMFIGVPGIFYALNWGRLRKPKWIIPTLLISIGLYMLSVATLIKLANLHQFSFVFFQTFWISFALYVGTVDSLRRMQWTAYVWWLHTRDSDGLKNLSYIYYFRLYLRVMPTLIIIVFLVMLVISAGDMLYKVLR